MYLAPAKGSEDFSFEFEGFQVIMSTTKMSPYENLCAHLAQPAILNIYILYTLLLTNVIW